MGPVQQVAAAEAGVKVHYPVSLIDSLVAGCIGLAGKFTGWVVELVLHLS